MARGLRPNIDLDFDDFRWLKIGPKILYFRAKIKFLDHYTQKSVLFYSSKLELPNEFNESNCFVQFKSFK